MAGRDQAWRSLFPGGGAHPLIAAAVGSELSWVVVW